MQRPAGRVQFRALPGGNGKRGGFAVGKRLLHPVNDPFIFLGIQGAGAIDQPPAEAKHGPCGGQNALLPGRAPCRGLLRPFGAGLRVAAEHALAAAGGVHQNRVEKSCPPGSELLRLGRNDQPVGHAHSFQIAAENFRTARYRLVADQQPPTLQRVGDLGALSPRGGAEIQHPLAGPGRQHCHRRHGAGFLNIVRPGFVQGLCARRAFLRQIAPRPGLPRHRLPQPFDQGRGIGQRLAGIEPQPAHIGLGQRGKIVVRFCSQLGADPLLKNRRQGIGFAHGEPPFKT